MAFDKAKDTERRIAHQMRGCVHFSGIQNSACEAGVNYRALVGGEDFGWAARIPCTGTYPGEQPTSVVCEQRRCATREEAEADIKASDEGFHRLMTCMNAIKARHGKARGLVDGMPCPTDCGGTLRYSIAGNGHVHGQCSTPGCARWMQ